MHTYNTTRRTCKHLEVDGSAKCCRRGASGFGCNHVVGDCECCDRHVLRKGSLDLLPTCKLSCVRSLLLVCRGMWQSIIGVFADVALPALVRQSLFARYVFW
eukprot:1149737-Amphidinium_carterae.2